MPSKNKYPLLNRWRNNNDIKEDFEHIGFVTARENAIWKDPSWDISKTRFENCEKTKKQTWRKNSSSVVITPSIECNTPYFNHTFSITTSYSISNKEFIDVEKVFYYVTLGGIINPTDLSDLREWVRRSVDSFNRAAKKSTELETVYIRISRPFDGKDDIYKVRRYMPEHYPAIAKGCINWAVMNNEKINYSR